VSRTGSTLLRHALAFAARDWYVFPCSIGSKRPALPENWQHLATTNRARIHRWWSHAPFNIGIACGPSGLVVIDLDIAKDGSDRTATGAESFGILCRIHCQPYPNDTFTVRTPSVIQGRHTPVLPGPSPPGTELRQPARPADRHPWIASSLDARTVTRTALPELLVPGTIQAKTYARAALRDEAATVAAARAGTRNNTLNRAACSLGQLVAASLLPAEEVTTALADASERCGLPSGEAHRTIRSGMASGALHPRAQRPAPS
jgi:hypothetical protein